MADPVRVTIVPNEVAADLVCTFLRAEGIRCGHRVTNMGAGSWDGVPNVGGAREVLVDPGRSRRGPGGARLGGARRVLFLSSRAGGADVARERAQRSQARAQAGGFSWCPPNWLRIAESTLFANSPSSREENRE